MNRKWLASAVSLASVVLAAVGVSFAQDERGESRLHKLLENHEERVSTSSWSMPSATD